MYLVFFNQKQMGITKSSDTISMYYAYTSCGDHISFISLTHFFVGMSPISPKSFPSGTKFERNFILFSFNSLSIDGHNLFCTLPDNSAVTGCCLIDRHGYTIAKSVPGSWRHCAIPWLQGSWGQHGAHLGPTGPRWAPCWPHELCYLGYFIIGGPEKCVAFSLEYPLLNDCLKPAIPARYSLSVNVLWVAHIAWKE